MTYRFRYGTLRCCIPFFVHFTKFLSCMCFGAAKETSVNITVVFFCLSYSLLAICEISQKDTIFYRWQIPATWCMNFMFTRRLGNFVYVVKITHNKECQLSGPLARVLISNWHCKYTILFYGKQWITWNFHANNIFLVWIWLLLFRFTWLFSWLGKKIPQPIRIGAKRNETKLFAYIIFVFDEYFYFTH